MEKILVAKIIMSVLDGLFAFLMVSFMCKSKEDNTKVGFAVMILGLVANIILMNL